MNNLEFRIGGKNHKFTGKEKTEYVKGHIRLFVEIEFETEANPQKTIWLQFNHLTPIEKEEFYLKRTILNIGNRK